MQNGHFQPNDLVIVTGAAQGFGRAIAKRFAQMEARLALWDINQEGVEETVAICQRAGAEARAYRVDLGERDDIEAAIRKVRNDFGTPFGLINNGAVFPRSPILKMDPAEWDRVLRVNLTAPFLCAQGIAPMMIANGRGVIVNISSTTALKGDANGAHYSASKAGVMSLTKSLALALAADNVRVNCIVPGIADTAQPLAAMTHEELVARGKGIPLGRIGTAEDIAGVAAFLLGPDAAYLTGQSIQVNGGAFMFP
jgi:NAD(P)-dependent dehydrogenase (short-subunit alcohol dehydrogenase family)